MTELQQKLISQIERKKTLFKTENYSMSIGELSNLYTNKEIIINPAFQRLFRWSEGQKVKLIESVILGIPIPPLFVYQNKDGIWELVDGLQRASSILQFMGSLFDQPKLILRGTKYLPAFEGFVWEKDENNKEELPDLLRLNFKRSKLNFIIIQSDSDPNAKFEVFQRLNTGGSNASNQEIRNSVLIMMKPTIFDWFDKMGKNENFLETISITERLINEEYNSELLLRLIALLKFPYDNKKDLGDYLDSINDLIVVSDELNFIELEQTINKTFKMLNDALSDKAFKKFDGKSFKGKFLESAYECIATGLAENIDEWNENEDLELLTERIQQLYNQDIFIANIGSGSNARTRIPRIVPFGKQFFKKNI